MQRIYETHVVPTLARTCDELAMEQATRIAHAHLLAYREGNGTIAEVRDALVEAEASIPDDSPLRNER